MIRFTFFVKCNDWTCEVEIKNFGRKMDFWQPLFIVHHLFFELAKVRNAPSNYHNNLPLVENVGNE